MSKLAYLYVSALLLSGSIASCSANSSTDDELDGGTNSGGSSRGGNGTGAGKGGGNVGNTSGIPIPVPATCHDGTVQSPEECDDGVGHEMSGDGCSAGCRVEIDYTCPPTGGICTSTAICGNGMRSSAEACDDGNVAGGDGCSADCGTVEDGWQCRVAGKRCVPFCGDGKMIGTENCDDGQMPAASEDGCSSTCLIEPGWSCTGTPSVCTKAVCGNGMVETGEACDKGAENGLFFGDATGCSKTCTQEPTCRDASGTTQACSTACGDGNRDVAAGEQCDDGNGIAGDGCSDTCMLEGGFMCSDMDLPDTEPCPSNPTLQCLVLPIIYRDFEGQQVSGGHPDFFHMGAPGTAGTPGVVGNKTACVPNASGTRLPYTQGDACPNSDAVGPCAGIAAPTLNAQGKPALAKDTCPCVFTDWDQTGVLAGVAGAQQCWVEGEGSMRDRIQVETMKVVKDAASFAQWYTTSSMSTEVRGVLELAAVGTQYQFSSSIPGAAAGAVGRTVVDDIHENCLGTTTPLQSGFFPVESSAGIGSTKLCNLWPYWKTGLTTANCVATAGNPIVAQWDPLAAWDACPMTSTTGGFVPNSSGTGTLNGMPHNFYFTTEARYLFRYDAPATAAFYGDDDVWVFVNGKLALDLGGPHERVQGMVAINETFGLEVGKIYEIAVFHADRHPRESNYQLTLSGFATTKTACAARCGDAVLTAGEECDEGDGVNASGVYNGCGTDCKYGPFCGDGVQDMEHGEECDLANKNGAKYGSDGCGSDCKLPHRCGDGIVDGAFNEDCDDGVANGIMGAACTIDCTLVVR
jgi:fibro-slime domain-containing protein